MAILVAATALTWSSPGPKAASQATPRALIGEFHATLLQAMRNARTLGFAGRRNLIDPRLRATFHLAVMARISVGSYWRQLTPDQKKALVDAFSRMTVATYADRFDNWTGERFEIRGVQEIKAKSVLVRTAIIRPNKEPVEINYLVRRFSSGWRVIDVYLKESYSELATRRSEYTSLLSRRGFPELLREIEAKIALYSSKTG